MRNLYVVALCALAVGCKSKGPAGTAAARGAPKVAFLLSTLQEERYQKDRDYFEAAAKKDGLDPFTLAADNDNARQLAQVEDALARGARVLVIQPTDSAAAAAYVGKAHDAGAKVVAYDRSIAAGGAGPPDFYVSHDSHEVGVMQAKAAVAATGGKGNYVILDGQSGHSVAMEIRRGYFDVLQPLVDKGDVEIVVEKYHDAWAPEQALKTVEDALAKSGGKVDAILANNSGMARGAVQAVQAAKLDHPVFIAGADADAANVEAVCAGRQSIEILKEIKPLAEKAAEVAAALAKGVAPAGGHPGPGGVTTAAVPVVLVTAANAKKLVVDSGFHTASEVPSCK